MKNKIKKILLLGMTAMFTAGAAGTAVISCPVWADEAEQNSETAEEPKAEDVAVEEELLIRQMIKQKYRFKNCRTSKNVCLFHPQILHCKGWRRSISDQTGTGRL